MLNIADYYCVLEHYSIPDYWNTIVETHDDFQSVSNRIQEIWNDHRQISEFGVSVMLHNRFGGELHVGVSKDGWLLIMRNPNEQTRIIRGQNQGIEGCTVFLLPEWTEFERHELLSPDIAKAAIKSWLDSGQANM